MKRLLPTLLIVLFAVSIGPFAFRTYAPLQSSEYVVGGELQPMVLPPEFRGGGKSIYFRRHVRMVRAPRHAWLQVMACDITSVYVNGKTVGLNRTPHPYNPGALLLDITSALRSGPNVIAVAVAQKSFHPPAMHIDGEVLVSDEHPQSLADGWKCMDHFERGADAYWFEPAFDDSSWRRPDLASPQRFHSQLNTPPGAIKRPLTVKWIAPPGSENGQGAIRRDFQLANRPHSGWLRVQANAPFQLSVNSELLFTDHEQLATPAPYKPRLYIFDISPRLRRGKNHVALMLSSASETPHVAADLETTDKQGIKKYWESDSDWMGAKGAPMDWMDNQVGSEWQMCRDEVGDVDTREMRTQRYFANASYRAGWFSPLTRHLAIWSIAAGIIAWIGCVSVGWLARQFAPHFPPQAAYAALAAPAGVCLAMMLVTFDSTIAQESIYQARWLMLAVGLVSAQWATMLFAAIFLGDDGPNQRLPSRREAPQLATFAALMVLVTVGIWLRTRDILLEPMHHDEVGAYFFTQSILDIGFPGGQIHPEMPFGYCATSELVYYFNVPFTFLFEDPRLVIRVPAVIWSIYTMVLMFFVTRRLFGLPSAVFAATLYCVSPYLVGMANFGRYFSQLQFFALLSCYAYYKTIEGNGPINRKWLWITAFSFLAMYFSWEGSGFTAVGMIVAALVHRRGQLKSILLCPSIYAALAVVGSGYLAQNSHRMVQQTRRLWYGTGISDVSIMPMWQYPRFDLLFYVREATWIADAAIPLLCVLGVLFIAVRHPRQEPLRVFLIIFLVTTIAMVLLLPLRATRYAYHMTPLLLIMSSVLMTTLARSIAKLGRGPNAPEWSRMLAGLSAGMVAIIFAIVSSGYCGQLTELTGYASAAYRPNTLKFPHWEAPLGYLRQNMQEGDAVIALHPHIVNMTMRLADDNPVDDDWMTDYWMQSAMMMQATLSDASSLPLDRRTGARMIGDRATLERVLNKHPRVWYLTIRHSHNNINHADVSEVLRRRMDVVYEDRATMVMLHDQNKNRTTDAAMKTDEAAELGRTWVLK